MTNEDNKKSREYLKGIYRGVILVRLLAEKLQQDDKEEMAAQMLSDLELLSLLLKKYDLIDDTEYEFLSDKADEEWEESHEPLPPDAFTGLFGGIGFSDLQEDRERNLRIRLLERLAQECEDDLYNEVAMGLDDDLFEKLLKEYGID